MARRSKNKKLKRINRHVLYLNGNNVYMRFKSFTITEAVKLTPEQLAKNNSKTGEARIDILMRLIQDKVPLELAKGGTFLVGDDHIDDAIAHCQNFKKNDSHYGRSGFPLTDKDGNEIKSNDLAKSKVMGGGTGGAGSGTKDTARNESHNACMMRAMVDDGWSNDLDHFDDARIAQAYKDNGSKHIDINTDQILETPDNWILSSYVISKFLAKEGYIHKGQVFDRAGPYMTLIYQMKNMAYKNNGFKPLKDDKWNPGDVWAVEKGLDLKKELDISSVGALNASIMKLFFERRLVAISLKGPEKSDPPPNKEYNIKNPPETPRHKLKQIKLESDRGDFWSSKGMELVYDSGSMTFKDNSPGGTNKAEIKGKKARGGGLSWGIMIDFIKRTAGKAPPEHAKGIKPIAKKISKGDKRATKLMFQLYSEFYKGTKQKDFEEQLQSKDWTWISAKLGALYVAYYLQKNIGTKADNIITNFVNYAGSDMLDSSTYVKVGK